MSSHHIVRDEQEPALFIADAQALSFDLVESLLEWSPTVMVSETVLDEVLQWGIKIDVVVAKYESIEILKPKLTAQSPVKLLGFESGDLLENGYQFLLDEGYKAVNVLADIFNSEALDLVKSHYRHLDSVIFYNDQKWIFRPNGFFEKWVATGHHLAIHPVAPNTFLTTEGFYTDWQNEMIMEPIELTSEVTGSIRIQANEKPLWIVEVMASTP